MVSLQSVPLKFSKYVISYVSSLSYISKSHLGRAPGVGSGYLLVNLIYLINELLKLLPNCSEKKGGSRCSRKLLESEPSQETKL